MAIEQLLADLTSAVEKNTSALEKLEAGRAAAIAQLEKKDAADGARTTRSRSKKAEPEAGPVETAKPEPEVQVPATAEPKAEAPKAAATTTAPELSKVEETLRDEVNAYLRSATNEAGKLELQGKVKTIVQHFGGPLIGERSNLDEDQRAQALFYVRRLVAGLTINFAQEYDFAGDPKQDSAQPATAEVDEFDIG